MALITRPKRQAIEESHAFGAEIDGGGYKIDGAEERCHEKTKR
jgi:hypothetical protein